MTMRKILCSLAFLSAATNTNAGEFYVGGIFGQAKGEVGATEMNNRMANLGYDAKAKVDGQDRNAWRLFGGYEYSKYLSIEAGYLDLGEVRTRLSGSPTDIQDYLDSANLVHPRSASGYELALLGIYPFNEKNSIFVRGGVLFANSRYSANSRDDFAKRTDDERDGFVGIGYAYEFNDRWGLRLSYDSYRVEDERINFAGLGLRYKFHSKNNSAQASSTKPTSAQSTSTTPKVNEPAPVKTSESSAVEQKKAVVEKSFTLAVQFDTNSSQLKSTYSHKLNELADFMKENPDTTFVIEGHTDSQGDNERNKVLSANRAKAVCDLLIKDLGISKNRLTATGYGEEKPVADNSTAEGRSKNRRVVAVLQNE